MLAHLDPRAVSNTQSFQVSMLLFCTRQGQPHMKGFARSSNSLDQPEHQTRRVLPLSGSICHCQRNHKVHSVLEEARVVPRRGMGGLKPALTAP